MSELLLVLASGLTIVATTMILRAKSAKEALRPIRVEGSGSRRSRRRG